MVIWLSAIIIAKKNFADLYIKKCCDLFIFLEVDAFFLKKENTNRAHHSYGKKKKVEYKVVNI